MIKQKLLNELKKSFAPFTKLKVACVLQTKLGEYYGHNYEKNDFTFLHAEQNAVIEMKNNNDSSGIKLVHIAGEGQHKIKRIAPCNECYEALEPFLNKKSKLISTNKNQSNVSSLPFWRDLSHRNTIARCLRS